MSAARPPILQGISGSMGSDDAAAPFYLHAVGVVAEAFGEGRASGGAGVVGDTLACAKRTSEPAAVVAWSTPLVGGRSSLTQGPHPQPPLRFVVLVGMCAREAFPLREPPPRISPK